MKIDGDKYKFVLNNTEFHCAMDVTMNFVGGKWKTVVLWYLKDKTKRFSELKADIPQITDKMLSIQLRALEEDGFIERTVYPEVPPRVEYCLTHEGKTLIPLLNSIAEWGKEKARRDGKMVLIDE